MLSSAFSAQCFSAANVEPKGGNVRERTEDLAMGPDTNL